MAAYDYGLGLGAPFVGNYGISSPAGYRVPPKTNQGVGSRAHFGTDYLTPRGTHAIASQDGVVTRVANDPRGYGRYVTIVNPQTGVATQWAHMDTIDVRPGQRVSRGQAIGRTGNTGNSSGAHLDYTVTHNGVAIRHDGTAFAPTNKSWLTVRAGGSLPPVVNPAAPVLAAAPTVPAVMPVPQVSTPQPVQYAPALRNEADALMAAMEGMEPHMIAAGSPEEFFTPTLRPWERNGGGYYG